MARKKLRVTRKAFLLLLLILSGPDPLCFSAQSRKSQTLDPGENLCCSTRCGSDGVALAFGDVIHAVFCSTLVLLTLLLIIFLHPR